MQNLDKYTAEFRALSLEALDAMKLLERYDTKYLVPTDVLPEFLSRLVANYSILEIAGSREFEYFNEYFDTSDFRFYSNHHNGKINRLKIRYRRYVETGVAFMEVKKKIKQETKKYRIPHSFDSFEFDAAATNFVGEKAGINSVELVPKLQIIYRRITLLNPKSGDKITIDRDLRFDNGENKYVLSHLAIIEVKTKKSSEAIRNAGSATQVLREMMISRTDLSKYCIGLVLTKSKVKYNRFKRKILLINRLVDSHDEL